MRLVADANVLLSAVIGGRASLILRHADVESVFTPAAALDEVYEYLPSLARKRRLRLDTLLLSLATLPVTWLTAPSTSHLWLRLVDESDDETPMMSTYWPSRFI